MHSGGVRYDCADERKIDRQGCGTSALFCSLPSELNQPLSIERWKLHTAKRVF
jgi:hypothetical protein